MLTEPVASLVRDLASPDPDVRDERAFPDLAGLLRSGQLPADELFELGTTMVARLAHPQIYARTFTPLILARIAAGGGWAPIWTDPVLSWWVEETDLRGYDAQLGWLHAVAHGADCVGRGGGPCHRGRLRDPVGNRVDELRMAQSLSSSVRENVRSSARKRGHPVGRLMQHAGWVRRRPRSAEADRGLRP